MLYFTAPWHCVVTAVRITDICLATNSEVRRRPYVLQEPTETVIDEINSALTLVTCTLKIYHLKCQ
jgi:hypothetical protein